MSKPILLIDTFRAGMDVNGNSRTLYRLTAIMPRAKDAYQRQYYFAGPIRAEMETFIAEEYPHALNTFEQGHVDIMPGEFRKLKRMVDEQRRYHASPKLAAASKLAGWKIGTR